MTDTLKSGAYVLVNCGTRKALDMHSGDRHKLIVHPIHGWSNQQWRLTKLGRGWAISSVHTPVGEGYVLPALSTNSELGCEVTTGYHPVSWVVKPAKVKRSDGSRDWNVYQISWPQSNLVLEVDEHMKVNLGCASRTNGEPSANQCWKFISSEENFTPAEAPVDVAQKSTGVDKCVQAYVDITEEKETQITLATGEAEPAASSGGDGHCEAQKHC